MARSQVVILAGGDPRGAELAAALRQRGWLVWHPDDSIGPGDDRDAALLQALDGCALVAVFSPRELTERAAVAAAIHRWRNDRSGRKVVPIGDVAGSAALTGLPLLQGLAWTDAAAAATRLDAALKGLSADDEQTARVLVVAHPTEVMERERIQQALANRRRIGQPVPITWVDTPGALDAAREADLVIVVVGLAISAAGLPTLQAIAALPKTQRFVRRVLLTGDALATCADLPAMMAVRANDAGREGEELVGAITAHLEAWIDERFQGQGASRLHDWERAWLRAKLDGWTRGHHTGLMAVTGGSALTRAALYVPARAGPGPWSRDEPGSPVMIVPPERSPTERPAPDELRHRAEPSPIWLDELATHRDLPAVVVEGEAGTGKTVLLQHLAAAVARRALGLTDEEEHRIDWDALSSGSPRLRVPILIEARRITRRLAIQESPRAIAALIAEEELSACGCPRAEEVQQAFDEGRYLLLVDARDEAPADQLDALDRVLIQLVHLHPRVRVVVATRPAAHTARRLGPPFVTVPVGLLDDDTRQAMVDRWCASMPTRHADRERDLPATLGELQERVGDASDGERSPLANPLFLTCAMLVYELDGQLPDGRADLYDKLVEVLCRPRGPGDPSGAEQERREVAIAVASAAQRQGQVALPLRRAAERVKEARGLVSVREAEQRIDAMAAHTMLWRYEDGPEGRVVRPWHRSFQEHLAARAEAATGRPASDVAESLREQLHAPDWAGCVRFLPGAFVAVHSDRGVEWIDALAAQARTETDPRRCGHLWALVADAVAEERARCFKGRRVHGSSVAATLAREVADQYNANGALWAWQDRLMLLDGLGRMATNAELDRPVPEAERDLLADPRLEDPRSGTGRWVPVKGGLYPLGDPDAVQSGRPRTEEVSAFWLLDTSVTVQDFRPFISTGAWRDPRHRPREGPDPELPQDWYRQLRHPNQPVWGVDWWDAVAFCRWASGVWHLPQEGRRVTLPTAAMWEAAARGPDGDVYPWGSAEPGQGDESRASHDWEPTGAGPFRHVTPVGAFPRGHRGPLWDLAGNVWEWTASPWSEDGAADPQDVSGDDKETSTLVSRRQEPDAAPRVVRGGSWDDVPRGLRAARRNWLHPGDRVGDLGFRVCVLREPGP